MATPHINAKDNAFAETVLLPGDPLRAKFIAETFLKNATQVTDVRNMLGFTGEYEGKKVSVMGSGMGIPSCFPRINTTNPHMNAISMLFSRKDDNKGPRKR